MSFQVCADERNPGQFFACCGLLELAERLAGEAFARFEPGRFVVEGDCTLGLLLEEWSACPIVQVHSADETASALRFGPPFDLMLDWWRDVSSGGKELKVWAGRMSSVRIARAMIAVLRDPDLHCEDLLNVGRVVCDPDDPGKKVEPFYFDARRAGNAHSRDVGFSIDALELTSVAYPAVEALCLVGLQRCRPATTEHRRVFEYRTWPMNLPLVVAAPVVGGAVPLPGMRVYQFESWFRTGQKKHKAFRTAVPIEAKV